MYLTPKANITLAALGRYNLQIFITLSSFYTPNDCPMALQTLFKTIK